MLPLRRTPAAAGRSPKHLLGWDFGNPGTLRLRDTRGMVPAPPSSIRASPVRTLPGEADDPPPTGGTGLCLSGGGYRAMLFHLGVVRRLDETGLLGRVDRVSSVSGGSILAGVLALAWPRLEPGAQGLSPNFEAGVTRPIRGLAHTGIDVAAGIRGLLDPRKTINEEVADAYREHLFGNRRLTDLPETPRFILNATNMGSGALVRFTRRSLTDWRVGRIDRPDVDLATAVACSSAFPPFLSPHRLDTSGMRWETEARNDLATTDERDELVLSDGGVYDNLGLETAWKRCRTVIVSDAGGEMAADADPRSDWPLHMLRVLEVVDHQVRSLRKQQVIDGLRHGDRDGVYLGIRSDIANYDPNAPLTAPVAQTIKLAGIATRLAPIDDLHQERLINWGYAIADAGVRVHLRPGPIGEPAFPYPAAGVG
jgi:NTE family protein